MALPPDVRYEGMFGTLELWSLGKVAVLMPPRSDDWPDELREAWSRRLEANLLLRCACGGTFRSRAPGTGEMRHTDACAARDERFAELLEAAG